MSLDKITSALLQDEGRGWKIDLFIDENVKIEYKCYYCHNICENAVELSCDVDHDDDAIQLYCERCLTEVIRTNNNGCPIDNHLNPTYASARRVRGKINKAKVLCPNSVVYKQQRNKDKDAAKGNIIVDTSDEKEGMGANVNVNDNNNEAKGCDFKGNLSELVKHISKCCESNLDSKELQIEIIKVLRNDINELKKNRQQIENTLVTQNAVIDELKKQNGNLVQKCNNISQQYDKSQTEMKEELQNGIDNLKNENQITSSNFNEMQNTIDELKKQNGNLTQKHNNISQQYKQQKERVDKSQKKMSTELRNGIDKLQNENQITNRNYNQMQNTLTTQNNVINELKKQNSNLLNQYTDMSKKFIVISKQYEQQKDRINKLESIFKTQNELLKPIVEEAKEEKETIAAVDLKILSANECKQLLKWLPGNKPKLQLLYRASRDGYDWKKYYDKIGNKSPTVCIIRTDKDYVFGGYTSVVLDGNVDNYKDHKDDTAFIFLLKSKGRLEFQKWQVKKDAKFAVRVSSSYGPIYGYNDHAFYLKGNMKEGHSFSSKSFNIDKAIAGESDYKVVDVEAYCVV